jgi:hypothetical protein
MPSMCRASSLKADDMAARAHRARNSHELRNMAAVVVKGVDWRSEGEGEESHSGGWAMDQGSGA